MIVQSDGGIVILRVIAGHNKGQRLKTLSDKKVRPTSDKVKEALFSILTEKNIDADVIDLFAGTGSLGIEALSRGAKTAVLNDNCKECITLIKQNLETTKNNEKAEVIYGNANETIKKLSKQGKKFDIIFLDPPYGKNLVKETLKFLSDSDIMKKDCIIVAEHDKKDEIPTKIGIIFFTRVKKYKDTMLSFFEIIK